MTKVRSELNQCTSFNADYWTGFCFLCIASGIVCLYYFQETVIFWSPKGNEIGPKALFPVAQFQDNITKLIPVIQDHYKMYLRLTNTVFISKNPGNESSKTKHLLEDIIRSGYGLQPYKTDRGEDAWMENGIVYRPSRTKNPNGYTPEFESYVPFDEDMFFEGRTPDVKYKTEKKIILWYIAPSYVPLMPSLKPIDSCPEFPCAISTNASLYKEKSSALIFAANKIRGPQSPNRTFPDQVYVVHNHESPHFLSLPFMSKIKQAAWKGTFNWTFSFRSDSDVVAPYAVVRKRPGTVPLKKDYKAIFANKTKMVAWAVSHCQSISKREAYVKILRQHIDVEIIGGCGKNDCPRSKREVCTDHIGKTYKFYLAFENAISLDYITEKLFLFLSRDIVIVARGSNEYYKHLPPEIFINTNDFRSPKELAHRLNYLAKNEEAYLKILREKDKYFTMFHDRWIMRENGAIFHNDFVYDDVPLCLLCQRLWNLDRHRKTMKDAFKWLLRGKCRAPKDIIV